MRINFNPDGYTVWAEDFPVILTDAPYERLKSDPDYAIEFVDLLYNEMAKTQEENKRLQDALGSIYNIDTMFMNRDGTDREYDYKEAHDVMITVASQALEPS